MVQRMPASDNEWQRMTVSRQHMTISDSEWQQVVIMDRRMDDCHFFCDYFQGLMAAIRVFK